MKLLTILAILPLSALSLPFKPRASAPTSASCGRRNTPRYCEGTAYNTSLLQTYLCGDSRLGPTKLPSDNESDDPLTVILDPIFYDRLGGLCPGAFISAWFNESSGWWNYPPQSGFTLVQDGEGGGEDGTPIQGNVTLPVDTLLDRFGSEFGTFVSPAGAPYAQRALPPSNLVAGQGEDASTYNYKVYSVVQELVVLAGPIAPWFGQPGAGVQYMLYDSVANLIEQGYLRREDPSVLIP
ncbi:hypothetical protein MFIFM68171_08933 [Madurella fahalii]|uniref:TNT domain-containing protein n=1 Tax=Madurella fahalii TaxID=1157608 RepID=A0ABQ0GLT6_9PEZI